MKRAPLVLASTAAGLGLVLGYNPHRTASLVTTKPAAVDTGAAAATTDAAAATDAATASAQPTTTSGGASSAATAASGGTATGTLEQISEGGRPFGEIQVKATVKDGKITDVSIVQLNPFDGRSASIDDYAIPQLVQETLAAGSLKIDAVSGATYTSEAYATSLQAALDQLP